MPSHSKYPKGQASVMTSALVPLSAAIAIPFAVAFLL